VINIITQFLYKHFKIKFYDTTVKTEVVAGITDYFTIIYIIMLVPEVLMGAFPGAISESGELINNYVLSNGLTAGEMLVSITAAAFAAAGIGSIVMGVTMNIPFIQGPSLAIGTFITYTICQNFGYTFNQALAIVFISGICFFIMSIFRIEKKIHNAIPENIKFAVTAGIGLFIAFAGFKKAHIIGYTSGYGSDINIFDFTNLASKYTKDAILALSGILLITIMLKKHIHGAIFIGKIICIIIAIPMGLISAVDIQKFSYSIKFSETFLKMDFSGLINFENSSKTIISFMTLIVIILSICIMDVFETMSMLIAADTFGEIDSKNSTSAKRHINQILEVDSITTSVGAALGATNVSTYLESTTGIIEGGRTGLTAVVAGILFLATIPVTPLVAVMPSAATATTLVMAGIIMMKVIKYIDFKDEAEAVPAFLTMFMMPLSNSLLVGVSFGVISYIIINLFTNNHKKINIILYILAVLLFVILLFLPQPPAH